MNIFQIQQELQEVFDILEENGGELTPELEEVLTVTTENFKSKIKDYVEVIKQTEADLRLIKEEQDRLNNVKKSKVKVIERLNSIIIPAIETYGDKTKNGSAYLDYGTGKVSVRNNTVVETNNDAIENLGTAIELEIECEKVNNQLDVIDCITLEDVNSYQISDRDGEDVPKYTYDDLCHTTLTLSVNVPASSLFNGEGYNIIKEMAKYTSEYKIESKVNKTEMKKALQEDGLAAPNLARLGINKTLTIK